MSLAVLALHDNALQPCQLYIDLARSQLDAEITVLVSESYSRAYRMMVAPTYCLLPTAYCRLPTAYCQLPTAYCLLPTAYCLLPTAYCLLPTAH